MEEIDFSKKIIKILDPDILQMIIKKAVSKGFTVPGFNTLPQPTSTLSPSIAPIFFIPVSIFSVPFFITINFLSDFTFDVIEPAPI